VELEARQLERGPRRRAAAERELGERRADVPRVDRVAAEGAQQVPAIAVVVVFPLVPVIAT
jgi:hypothetical protein